MVMDLRAGVHGWHVIIFVRAFIICVSLGIFVCFNVVCSCPFLVASFSPNSVFSFQIPPNFVMAIKTRLHD